MPEDAIDVNVPHSSASIRNAHSVEMGILTLNWTLRLIRHLLFLVPFVVFFSLAWSLFSRSPGLASGQGGGRIDYHRHQRNREMRVEGFEQCAILSSFLPPRWCKPQINRTQNLRFTRVPPCFSPRCCRPLPNSLVCVTGWTLKCWIIFPADSEPPQKVHWL